MQNKFNETMNNIVLLKIFLLLTSLTAFSQNDTLFVLFLGNSYTNVNNLPQLTSNLSNAGGKMLIVDSNTPGGYTLDSHSTNSTSLNKIMQGKWDYVILQEQSQIPTIDYYRYNSMYPAFERLNDSIKKYNPCANVVSYMTWGRRYGGQQCDDQNEYCSPDFVDFSHMQDSLESAYVEISNSVDAYISPVGIAWKKVIEETEIVLHAADNSHPNLSGSYLAACVFYSVFWNESPVGLNFNGGLSNDQALYFQQIADSIVFFSTNNWNLQIDAPVANFSYNVYNDSVQFLNLSESFEPASYVWDFGDGATSNLKDPYHIFAVSQDYLVSLITSYCANSDTMIELVTIDTITRSSDKIYIEDISFYPNPFRSNLVVVSNVFPLNYQIDIKNIFGQTVFASDLNNNRKKILEVDYLSCGIYFLTASINGKGSQKIYKIIKE